MKVKDYSRIEQKSNICINVFCYQNGLTYLVFVSNKEFENYMDLLMITDENKPHYVCINIFKANEAGLLYFKKNLSNINITLYNC